MKKVLIISLLLFIIILGSLNTVYAKSNEVMKLRIGEKYTFNNVSDFNFSGNYIRYTAKPSNNDNDPDAEVTYTLIIEGTYTGESIATFTINGQEEKITIKVAERFLENVLIIPPAKTKYAVGENLDLDGLKITAVYDRNQIEEVKEGYTVTGFNKNKEGFQTVTISYKGFSRSYEVKVGNVAYNVDDEGKLPQTGNFSILRYALYTLITILSSILVFIIYKSFKYRKV